MQSTTNPKSVIHRVRKINSKFIWNNKKHRIAKTIINSKRTSWGSQYPGPQAILQSSSIKKLHGIGTVTARWINEIGLKTQN